MSDTTNSDCCKTEKTSVVRGKDVSLVCKILGGVFLATIYIVKFIVSKQIPTINETFSILLATVGLTNVLSFTIDLSMIIKNIKGGQ